MEDGPRRSLLRHLPLGLIAAGAVTGLVLFRDRIDLDTLREHREGLGLWVAANPGLAELAYMAAYVGMVAFSLPGGLVMTLAGGFLFGTVTASAMVAVAATAGAALVFLAARSGLGSMLQRRLSQEDGRVARLAAGIRENAVSVLLLMRLVPVMPFWLANLAPAFLGVPFRTYLWTTFIGILPATVLYAGIGAGLGEVFARGETPDLSLLADWRILLPLAGLCLLALLPVLLRARRG